MIPTPLRDVLGHRHFVGISSRVIAIFFFFCQVGAKVLLLKNLDSSSQLVNGATGVVIEFADASGRKLPKVGAIFFQTGVLAPFEKKAFFPPPPNISASFAGFYEARET